jgi:hypothetical protein
VTQSAGGIGSASRERLAPRVRTSMSPTHCLSSLMSLWLRPDRYRLLDGRVERGGLGCVDWLFYARSTAGGFTPAPTMQR